MALPPFQSVLDAHASDAWRMLVATVGRDRADDCFQETVVAALRAYPSLRADSNPRAWLLTIAGRKAIDEHRAAARRPVPVAEPEPELAVAGTGFGSTGYAGMTEVWSMVAELPTKQRSALTLRYLGDLAYTDIAAALDCSDEAARRSVHEGLKTLRERMNGDGG